MLFRVRLEVPKPVGQKPDVAAAAVSRVASAGAMLCLRRRFTPATAAAAGAVPLVVAAASATGAGIAPLLVSRGGSGGVAQCGDGEGGRDTSGAPADIADGASEHSTRSARCAVGSARTTGCDSGSAVHRRSRANALVALAAHRGCTDAKDADMVALVFWLVGTLCLAAGQGNGRTITVAPITCVCAPFA